MKEDDREEVSGGDSSALTDIKYDSSLLSKKSESKATRHKYVNKSMKKKHLQLSLTRDVRTAQ